MIISSQFRLIYTKMRYNRIECKCIMYLNVHGFTVELWSSCERGQHRTCYKDVIMSSTLRSVLNVH